MEQISDLRANFRLGKLLYYFKTLNDTAKGRAQLEKLQVTFHVTRAPHHRGVLFATLDLLPPPALLASSHPSSPSRSWVRSSKAS